MSRLLAMYDMASKLAVRKNGGFSDDDLIKFKKKEKKRAHSMS